MPLKSILTNRHVGTNGACPICHHGAKDIKHLLFDCIHARELWSRLGISETIAEARSVNRLGSIILEHLLLGGSSPAPLKPNLDVKQVIVVGSWYLWWIRRQFTHDGTPPPTFKWPMSVLAIANNYHQVNEKMMNTTVEKWRIPEPRFVKLNVDAAFYVEKVWEQLLRLSEM